MTVPFQMERSAEFASETNALRGFAALVPKTARVLATMRAATVFADAGQVSPLQDWDGKTDYDVVVLDSGDGWGQTTEQIKAALERFAADGSFTFTRIGRFGIFVRR